MRQRIPRRAWLGGGPAGHRPRVLIENDSPALAISDFSAFERAGLDVAFCPGPEPDGGACPVLAGEPCPALASADVVLQGLDPAKGVAAAIRRIQPGIPVIVGRHRLADGTDEPIPDGCLPLTEPCSVGGQIDAVLRVAATHGAS
jgi:hypothetical protein